MPDADQMLLLGLPAKRLPQLQVLAGYHEKIALAASTLASEREKVDTNPSEAKKESGTYRKGHVSWKGLRISIENPKGSTRSGTSGSGKKWSITMKNDYGYFRGSVGKDKDHVDVFIGPHLDSELVFVVNQVDPNVSGHPFDEHKCIVGAVAEKQAREIYLANYEDGWQGLGSIVPMTLPDFKKWILDSEVTVKMAADTVQAYKLFRTLKSQPGSLYPLFIGKDKPVPQGEMVPAENIPTKGFASRPGWHAGALPSAPHLRSRDDRIQPGRVWAEVELPADVDWQSEADASPTGDIRDRVPEGGHYRKSTPRMQGGEWLIGGGLKIRQVLSDDEVSNLLRQAGEHDAAERERQEPTDVKTTSDETEIKTAGESGSRSSRGSGNRRLGERPTEGRPTSHSVRGDHEINAGVGGTSQALSGVPREKVAGAPTSGSDQDTAAAEYHERGSGQGTCSGCGKPFPAGEPYPDVDMCEVCERFGPSKKAEEEHVPTVAVDMDGTLAQHYEEFDEDHIPPPKAGAKKWMDAFRDAGARIIINTVRGKDSVTKAWLKENDIPYDYINENPDQPEGSSDKVYADVYWDDRAVSAQGRLAYSAPDVLDKLKAAGDNPSFQDPQDVLEYLKLCKDAA